MEDFQQLLDRIAQEKSISVAEKRQKLEFNPDSVIDNRTSPKKKKKKGKVIEEEDPWGSPVKIVPNNVVAGTVSANKISASSITIKTLDSDYSDYSKYDAQLLKNLYLKSENKGTSPGASNHGSALAVDMPMNGAWDKKSADQVFKDIKKWKSLYQAYGQSYPVEDKYPVQYDQLVWYAKEWVDNNPDALIGVYFAGGPMNGKVTSMKQKLSPDYKVESLKHKSVAAMAWDEPMETVKETYKLKIIQQGQPDGSYKIAYTYVYD